MTPDERRALISLKGYKNIVIKPADKGGAIVVLDRTYYIDEIRQQLGDTSTYRPLPRDPTSHISTLIQEKVKMYKQKATIDDKLCEFLINNHPITPVFYTLPKIHKNLTSPPGRPIVASTDSLFSPISITLEKIFTPHIPKIASYLKDTNHFLTIIRSITSVPSNCLLVTLDVSSLYTSINHHEGLHAVDKFLDTYMDLSPPKKDFCLDMLEVVLTKNFFLFEDQFFLQCRGTAMGSNVAPPYANIYMDFFEHNHIYPHPLFENQVALWKRYIDDIFLIWTGDITSLTSFFSDINNATDNISFTLHHSDHSINFLDTTVIINADHTLSTDLYTKPTDRNSLLLYSSCHPRHIKRSLPHSQHCRVDRIVSDSSTRDTRHIDMDKKFLARGYPSYAKPQTLTPTPDSQSRKSIPFVSTYHPFSPLINGVIFKHWPLLRLAYPTVPEFVSRPLICHNRPQNLRDSLVRADIGPSKPLAKQTFFSCQRKGTFPCLHCLQCSHITKGEFFTHPRTGKKFPIPGYFTCESNYVIYLIKCPCGLGYVGETTQHIRDRINKHKSTIRCKLTTLPIPAHFHTAGHSIPQLRFQVIEQIIQPRRGGNRIKTLREREAFWIHTLQTMEPLGLNREYDAPR
ncbi:uncharacterized protein [Dendrobates tinctorius]|uniref:uncharacterized protein n=1 Tax=Dendrobates tinctorius TaxID=92724 RepID=UPI003CC94E77